MKHTVKGSLKRCMIFAIFWGLLIYFAIYFLSLLFNFYLFTEIAVSICCTFPFIPYSPWSGVISLIIICMAIGLVNRSSVKLNGDMIRIFGWGKLTRFPLKAFDHIEIDQKQIIITVIPISIIKCYLYYYEDKHIKRCRLYGFDEKTADKLKNLIRINDTEQIDRRSKSETVNSVVGAEFVLNHDELFAKESMALRRAVKILGIVSAISILIICWLSTGSSRYNSNFYLLILLTLVLIIYIPIVIISFQRRKARCPSFLKVTSSGIVVDKDYYTFSNVIKVQLLTMKKSPLIPTQYYLLIKNENGAKKYWLGSDFSYPKYYCIRNAIRDAMVFCPEKLEYRDRYS